MLVNGQLDFPIVASAHEDLHIQVFNHLDQNTTIHWHGLEMRDSPWMDGADMVKFLFIADFKLTATHLQVSQCPIPPGGSFNYSFNVGDQLLMDECDEANGLRGPLIINDVPENDPYHNDYDDELLLTVVDHFHRSGDQILDDYHFANDPAPASGLINGLGRVDCVAAREEICVIENPRAILEVVPGKRYKVRVINMSAEAGFRISIDGHKFTMIEADASYTNPAIVDSFEITAGQRYSFILNATLTPSNYWIRAVMSDMYTPAGSNITNGLNRDLRAILHYSTSPDSPETDPVSEPVKKPTMLNSYDLGALNGMTPSTLPAHIAVAMTLRFTVNGEPNTTVSRFSLERSDGLDGLQQRQYMLSSARPTLKGLLLNGLDSEETGENWVVVANNSWAYVVLINEDNVDHTFHLHGSSFHVLSGGNMKPLWKSKGRPYLVNPTKTYPLIDSIKVPGCSGGNEGMCNPGFVAMLMHFDNPGAWLFHCHIDWHMATGLSLTFVNDAVDQLAKNIPQDFWTC
ncbi:hypothetical protein HDU83_000419 [Entophlyctis luteolus]|nr:hypothetical protein HDU83_000419 [Entophlyctis luteolus]